MPKRTSAKPAAHRSPQPPQQQQEVFSLSDLPRRSNPNLPTLAVDAVGTMTRRDPVVVFQFFAYTQEAQIEVARIQMALQLVKEHVDTLAKAINYYPLKPTESGR